MFRESNIYRKSEYEGKIKPSAAQIGEAFLDGDIGYHMRKGRHYFSREDWQRLMEFVIGKGG